MQKISKFFIILTLITIPAVSWLYFFAQQHQSKPLPVLDRVPDFILKDTNSMEFSLKNLENKVWVVDFIFTTCSGICPVMTKNMVTVYNHYRNDDNVRLVSVSVNPEYDSPDVLKKYAERFSIDTAKWQFLTGARAEIERLAIEGFKIGSVKEPIFHSGYLVLVDQKGNIRGFYDGMEKKRVKQLVTDIQAVLGGKI